MSYLSLYRKYRSQSFEDLAGQEHVTRTLQNALRAGRVAHAYLFSGPRGTGKTSSARLLARALNCERGPTPTPCGECVACHEIRDGISPSVVEIDAASSRGIDEVRELRQRAMTVPSQPGARKVFIVDEVHMLTPEACNALLKTLEEPPAHVLFVLATTDAQKLPATILSRCQRFEFRRGSVGLLSERIRYVAEAEGYTIEPEAVRLVARASGGSWRDAISLLEQVLSYGETGITAAAVAAVLGAVEEETLLALADGLANGEGHAVYPMVEQLIGDGTEPRQLARDLGEHFRALLMADAGALPAETYQPETAQRLAEQSARFGTRRLIAALEALAQAEKEMRWSDSGRVVLEVALARLMLPSSAVASRQSPVASSALPGVAAHRVADGRRRPPVEPAPVARASEAGEEMSGPRPPMPEPAKATAGPTPQPSASDGADGLTAEFDPFEHEELPPAVRCPARGSHSEDQSSEKHPQPEASPVPRDDPPTPHAQRPTPNAGLEQVRERWNVVLEELKRKRWVPTQALLTEAQPLRCEAGILVLGFRYDSHRDLWERGENKRRLAAALEAVLGQALQVRSEVIGDGPSGGTGPEPVPPPGASDPTATRPTAGPANPQSAPGDALEGEPLLHEVIALFEGHIVATND